MDEWIDAAILHLKSLPGRSVIASSDDLLGSFGNKPAPRPVPAPVKVEVPPVVEVKREPKVERPKKAKVELQLPSVPVGEPKSEMARFFSGLFPQLRLHEEPPSDAGARRVKEAWKEQFSTPDVAVLCSDPKMAPFLKNVARAISLVFFPCRVVEVAHLETEGKWDLFLDSPNLKWVLAPDGVLWGCKKLLPFFKEYPKQNTRFLGKVPLLLLPDIKLYFKDPYLKRSLWNLLCQTLSQPSS